MKLFICFAALVLALPCFAGQSLAPEVTITVNSATVTTATGSVRGAAASSDALQLMSCKIIATKPSGAIGSTTLTGECIAVDRAGVQLSCITVDSKQVEAIETLTPLSTVTFIVDSSKRETCRSITIDNSSAGLM